MKKKLRSGVQWAVTETGKWESRWHVLRKQITEATYEYSRISD